MFYVYFHQCMVKIVIEKGIKGQEGEQRKKKMETIQTT